MDVPATRPEVTTSGIYGEELSLIRQRLLRSELSWCGDLTARTQALIVGRVTPVGSRKLAVARVRRLPCVSPSWVADGACSLDTTDAFDIGHELTGKEVCTTSLNHVERGRVQAVCVARSATYNALLTRMCGLLVAPAAALAFTSPSASSPATANDKIRFARKHGIWIMSLDEFALRYGVEASTGGSRHRLSERGSGREPRSLSERTVKREEEGEEGQAMSPLQRGSRGVGETSRRTRSEVPAEPTMDIRGDKGSRTAVSSSVGQRGVLVPGSVRCTALSVPSTSCTPRTSVVASSSELGRHVAPTPVGAEGVDKWRSSAAVAMSAVQPSLPSQPTAIAATGTCLTPSLRLHGDEFSDVVAYCSPPYRLTVAQHDLLSGMGVAVTPLLTPCTTHVLVLGDGVEECFFPRPGLQVVSWQWIVQSQVEQRRLSCAAFRLPLRFCPVITLTGLSASDKQELVASLRRTGLPCEVQEALVLGGCRGTDLQASARASATAGASFLPQSTTHLVCLPRHLLASQKVAVLVQHSQQHQARRRLSSLPHGSLSPSSSLPPSSACRLIGVEWVYRSMQQGHWLDPDLFALAVPHPEAFALAAAAARTATARDGGGSSARLSFRAAGAAASAAPFAEGRPLSQPISTLSLVSPATVAGFVSAPPISFAPASPQVPPPPLLPPASPPLPRSGPSPTQTVVVSLKGEEEEEDDDGGAALSQHHPSGDGDGGRHASATAQPTPPSLHSAVVGQREAPADDEDEEAGGESPSATAARHSALQALHSSQPPPLPSPQPSPVEPPPVSCVSPCSADRCRASGGAVVATESLARTRQLTAAGTAASTSHLYLNTQYSPTFENLLGELEAYPTSGGVIGGAPPFTSIGAPPPHPQTVAASSSSGQVADAPHAPEAESALCSPPNAADALAVQQGVALLQRASLYRQNARGQHPLQDGLFQQLPQHAEPQQQQQQRSFVAGRHASDESQVIFYQMGLGDTPLPTTPSQEPSQRQVDTVTATTTPRAHAASRHAVPSSASSAVFLITRDIQADGDFDWDAFAARLPHLRRTSKPEECTHFVTAKPSKTEQFLCCLAAGRWVLTPAYLAACAAAGFLVKEDAFEWSAAVANALGCRASVASLVRGCRVQRLATTAPFAHWQVQVCCSTVARADSFMRVLRNGGCVSPTSVSAGEVLEMAATGAAALRVDGPAEEFKVLLADETVFAVEELEGYARWATAHRLCPLLRMDYLVQFLCLPETPTADVDLLHCLQARKRARVEASPSR